MFGQALKSNDSIYFAVLTGCLRVVKKSIFTGLNNLKVFSVTDVRYCECFGFLEWEVRELLKDYGLEEKYELVKEWYDGYCFGNAETIEMCFRAYLQKTISIRDTSVRKEKKENFFHGIEQSGDGFSDILLELEDERIGIVIEVKYPDGGDLEKGCQKALHQIGEKGYDARLKEDGMEKIIKYGIACWKRNCKVQCM